MNIHLLYMLLLNFRYYIIIYNSKHAKININTAKYGTIEPSGYS